jgi:hypothetical protein
MDRRKFLSYVGCGCCGFVLNACSTAPITERRQLKIIPESKLNAQAAEIMRKLKKKRNLSPIQSKLMKLKKSAKKWKMQLESIFIKKNLMIQQ